MAAGCQTKNPNGCSLNDMTLNDHNSAPNSAWRSSASVERWCNALLHLIRCTPREVTEKVDLLLQFCAEQQVSPERLINERRYGPYRMGKRAFYLNVVRRTKMNLVVQSFLVHNGINVFGELVCMPSTTKSMIEEQGEQWELRHHKGSYATKSEAF